MKHGAAKSLTIPLEWLYRLGWLALFLWVVLTFKQYGISNDEYVQHVYGQMLLDWYHSGFTDQDAFHYRNLYLYGGLFDIVAAAIDPYIPMMVWDIRHLLSAGFGLMGFYAVSRFANLLGGRPLSLLSMWLLFLTVSWSGTMMTHTKDIPFAACMMWALYATALVVRDMEYVSGKVIVLLGLSIGSALGLRVGGVFAVFYLIILVSWRIWLDHKEIRTPVISRLLKMFMVLLPAGILAFVFMAICWPWSVIEADNLMEAVKSFSHFDFNMQTIANGVVYNISEVPRSYLLQYLAVKLPEVELLGLAVLTVLWLCCRKKLAIQDKQTRLAMHTLLLATTVPLLFVMHDRPALYNGVRHFTFLLPLLAILGSWGIIYVWRVIPACFAPPIKATLYQALWAGLITGLMLITFADIIKLHPYQYVRLNRLAGNPVNAQYKWEGDYWSSALREASKQLLTLNLPKKDTPYWVGACVDTSQIEPYLDDRFKVTRNWDESDFYISTTHMHCHEVMKGTPVIRVERMGMLLAVVRDRRLLQGKDRMGTPAKN